MDFATLLRILPIAMQFIQSASDPTTPVGELAQELRNLLSQHKTQLDHLAATLPLRAGVYGTQPPAPEHLKTPEDLLRFIKSQPPTGGAGTPRTPPP